MTTTFEYIRLQFFCFALRSAGLCTFCFIPESIPNHRLVQFYHTAPCESYDTAPRPSGFSGCLETLEPQHRLCAPFDSPVLLLHEIIEVLDLANLNAWLPGFFALFVLILESCSFGSTLVDGDLLR